VKELGGYLTSRDSAEEAARVGHRRMVVRTWERQNVGLVDIRKAITPINVAMT
jgi:hypothetical protein